MARKQTAAKRSAEEILADLKPRESMPRRGRAARTLVHALQENLIRDLTESDLAKTMGLTVPRLRTLKERLYRSEEAALQGKTPARIFIDFSIQQLGCIRRLDAIADACLAGNQAAGAVGAVKAKADLYHRILTTGQELGVLARQPKEVRVLGRIDVTHMTTADLKRQVEAENRALVKLAASLDAPATDRALLAEAVATGKNGNAGGHPRQQDSDSPSRDPGEG